MSARRRIVLATAWHPPHHLGGTEVYVAGLARELARRGFDCRVLAPRAQGAPPSYEYEGVRVDTYPEPTAPQATDAERETFRRLLGEDGDVIYHQHAWTRGCGPLHLRIARAHGLATALTLHTAGALCLRGTMRRFGRSACDGRIDARDCAMCWAMGRGASPLLARMLGHAPMPVARALRGVGHRAATALAAPAIAEEKATALRALFADSDRIVAVCGWLHAALALNGAPVDKLHLCRHGLPDDFIAAARAAPAPAAEGPLNLVYLGRWDRAKGVDVAVDAVRALPPEVDARLTIHAPSGEDAYERETRARSAGDPRIVFAAPLARDHLAQAFGGYHALLAPSLGLETGPLVVLEAQAAGVFVLGSRLGGVAELVAANGSGELLAPGDTAAWSAAIARLAERRRAGALARVPARVRSMADVAADTAAMYEGLRARAAA